jgi:WD40 repeat protein
MAVCLTEFVALYQVEASGKLVLLLKVQGDFLEKDPSLNQCVLSKGVLVTGGDDTKVRIHSIKDNSHKEITQTVELPLGPTQPVTGVDISADLSRVVATSKDA